MFNCYKVYINGEVYAIVPTEARAKSMIYMIQECLCEAECKYCGAYIENIGF